MSIICIGEKKGSIFISCGTTPIFPLTVFGSSSRSTPQTFTFPEVLFVNPDKILMKVLLPAPFGPSKPKIDPELIDKFMWSKAKEFPDEYFLVKPTTSIILFSIL